MPEMPLDPGMTLSEADYAMAYEPAITEPPTVTADVSPSFSEDIGSILPGNREVMTHHRFEDPEKEQTKCMSLIISDSICGGKCWPR